MSNRKKKSPIICRCNNVSRETIEQAIREGCDTMNKIFDATTAGVGPCGGSCRRKLLPLLEHYLATGTFPEKIAEDLTGKKDPTSSDSGENR
ncbi:MAG: bacterioferritin-associated ferredoxin [Pseudobdellovibrionaceae bacterium]